MYQVSLFAAVVTLEITCSREKVGEIFLLIYSSLISSSLIIYLLKQKFKKKRFQSCSF